jgi:hypothetical protein
MFVTYCNIWDRLAYAEETIHNPHLLSITPLLIKCPNPNISNKCLHFSILNDFRKFSEWCMPGGQSIPRPCRSILRPSRASQLPYFEISCWGRGGALLTGGGGQGSGSIEQPLNIYSEKQSIYSPLGRDQNLGLTEVGCGYAFLFDSVLFTSL